MSKLRVGDVVKVYRDGGWIEARIRLFENGWVDTERGESGATTHEAFPEHALTLLRRPLRVGDRVVHAALEGSEYSPTTITETGLVVNSWHNSGWTHESGVAIDVPADHEPAVRRCDHSGIGLPGCPTCDLREQERQRAAEPAPSLDGLQLAGGHGAIRVVAHPLAPPGGMLVSADQLAAFDAAYSPEERAKHSSPLFGRKPPGLHPESLKAATEKMERALFATDPLVINFVNERAETDGGLPSSTFQRKWDATLMRAFDRREPTGARERAEARAVAVLAALRGR